MEKILLVTLLIFACINILVAMAALIKIFLILRRNLNKGF